MDLNDYLQKAREGKYALAHFNFASAEQLKAIVQAFQNVVASHQLPITSYTLMVGTSEGEGKFIGHAQARALVDAWKKETGLPLFLNADPHSTGTKAAARVPRRIQASRVASSGSVPSR